MSKSPLLLVSRPKHEKTDILRGPRRQRPLPGPTGSQIGSSLRQDHRNNALATLGDIEIVPVCAELLTVSQRNLSSSRIAERLFEVLVADGRPVPQLTGFPAYVPRHYDEPAREAIWRMIRDVPNYERILHGPDSFAGRMDALLTAVGHTEHLVLGGLDDLLRAAGMPAEELHRLVVGDIGGILVPRPHATRDDRKVIAELNAMWTGISLDQVAAIARRAGPGSPAAGVVVLALRSKRAPTLVEVVRQGLASHLIIDHEAAAGLNACLRDTG